MAGISKNQRRSSAPSSSSGFQMQRDMRLLIPLHEGYVYLLDPKTGRNMHLKLRSERGRAEIARVAADGHADRLRAEIDTLSVKYPDPGWTDARAALVPAPTEEQPA